MASVSALDFARRTFALASNSAKLSCKGIRARRAAERERSAREKERGPCRAACEMLSSSGPSPSSTASAAAFYLSAHARFTDEDTRLISLLNSCLMLS